MRKNKIVILLLLVCLQSTALFATRVDEIRKALLNPNSEKVLVVAHRGDWRNAPENSLAAIENVIKMKVDVVELDVKRTKDGHLILMHDKTLNRTSSGKGLVAEKTLEELKRLCLRNGCGIKTKHTIPTLEEAMLAAKGKIMVNLDHAYGYFDEIYDVLVKTGTVDHVIMKGGDPIEKVRADFGKYLDKVIYMPVVTMKDENTVKMVDDYLEKLHPVAFELCCINSSDEMPMKMKTKLSGKSLIWYNTLWSSIAGGHDDDMSLDDLDNGYGYLIEKWGARIIQTDRPAYLIDYLRSKGLHD